MLTKAVEKYENYEYKILKYKNFVNNILSPSDALTNKLFCDTLSLISHII